MSPFIYELCVMLKWERIFNKPGSLLLEHWIGICVDQSRVFTGITNENRNTIPTKLISQHWRGTELKTTCRWTAPSLRLGSLLHWRSVLQWNYLAVILLPDNGMLFLNKWAVSQRYTATRSSLFEDCNCSKGNAPPWACHVMEWPTGTDSQFDLEVEW